MVAAFDRSAKPAEESAEVIEADVGIRRTPQYSQQNRLSRTSLCRGARSSFSGFQQPCVQGTGSRHGLATTRCGGRIPKRKRVLAVPIFPGRGLHGRLRTSPLVLPGPSDTTME